MTRSTCWKTFSRVCALIAVTAISASAQTFTTLVTFNGPDGSYPGAFLAQGTDGNLYGTTVGSEAIFKITTAGTLTTLYTFSGPDGRNPVGLTLGTDENFYGMTNEGGSSAACSNGCGTVFKITPGGVLTTLHSFDITDGSFPSAVLIQGTDGNFYGTTPSGGTDNSCVEYGMSGCGTVFRITPAGAFTTLHSFNATDGWEPSGLVQGTDGNFYGTTTLGGVVAVGANKGGGTIFKISSQGALTTLYDFCSQAGCTDGELPYAGLIQATDGNFYGTTAYGGNAYCYYGQQGGTVFRMTPKGKLATLHSFCFSEGRIPAASLLQATDGNLYSTANVGGSSGDGWCTAAFDVGCGSIFKVAVDTGLTTLVHTFDWTDGSRPFAALVQGTNGTLYGTTLEGGQGNASYADGTVFSQSFGAPPFVTTLPNSRKVGQHVAILGTDLTGATSVTFNGTPATFKIVSSTEISSTVPTGATTGTVQVVSPSGTLSSNVPFRVTK